VFPSPKIFSYEWMVQLKSIAASVQATDAERCENRKIASLTPVSEFTLSQWEREEERMALS
jgi:hypothetical protein